ncbi:MAG: thioredoxin family protein [Cyanobacteria bacterium P01_A01_bin.45]
MSQGVIEITDSEFDNQVIKAEQPVLVYFWASWCGPCKLMSPLISKAASKYSDRLKIVKMEIDPNPATVKQFQVEGVPALRFIVNEQVLGTVEGVIGNDKLIDFIDTYLEKN